MKVKERVIKSFACPKCHNRVIDKLVWIDDDTVKCAHCQTEYNPLTGDYSIELLMTNKCAKL